MAELDEKVVKKQLNTLSRKYDWSLDGNTITLTDGQASASGEISSYGDIEGTVQKLQSEIDNHEYRVIGQRGQ